MTRSLTDTDDPSPSPIVLITRPAEDAAPLLDAIRALGLDGMIEPMLRIEPVADAEIDIDGCRALLFTSANGVRAFSQLSSRRDLPVLAVGPASAQAASEAGFEDVEAAAGDVDALVQSVRARFSPGDAPFFHAAGTVTAGDLKGRLEALGYQVRRVPLYRAEPASELSDACLSAFDTGRIAATTFFSPRTATAFVRLLQDSGRAPRARTAWAVCLSDAVAAEAGGVEWTGIKVSESRESNAMIAAIADLFGAAASNRAGAMTEDKKTPEEEAEGDAVAEPVQDLNADAVIDAFGGIRPMASKLDVAVSTVQGWKTRGHIPDSRWRDIIAAAGAHDIDLSVALPNGGAAPAEEPVAAEEVTPWAETTDEPAQDVPDDQEPAPSPEVPDEATDRAAEEGVAESPVAEETTTEAEAAPPAPATQGGGKLALLVGVAALAAVVARPVWAPYVDPYLAKYAPQPTAGTVTQAATPPDMSGELAALASDIAALRQRVEGVESRPVATGGESDGGAATASLDGKLSTLEADLAALRGAVDDIRAGLERDTDTRDRLLERLGVIESLTQQATAEAERAMAGLAGVEATIQRQGDAIATLESRPAIEGAAQAGLALAVGDVESAMADGRPFPDALDRLKSLADGDPGVTEAAAALDGVAASGVPTRAELLAAFRRDAPAMQTELGKTDGDVLDTLMDGARALVSIRRKGDAPDDPPVSRAEAALLRGDLTGAVAALTPVRGASGAVDTWLQSAEARLSAEAALRDLRRAVAAGLSGGAAPASTNGDGT